jgi:hypothetical protein
MLIEKKKTHHNQEVVESVAENPVESLRESQIENLVEKENLIEKEEVVENLAENLENE